MVWGQPDILLKTVHNIWRYLPFSFSLISRVLPSLSSFFLLAVFSGSSSQKSGRFALGVLDALHSTLKFSSGSKLSKQETHQYHSFFQISTTFWSLPTFSFSPFHPDSIITICGRICSLEAYLDIVKAESPLVIWKTYMLLILIVTLKMLMYLNFYLGSNILN